MKTKTAKKGFTLIELIVAITIVVMFVLGGYMGYKSIKEAKRINASEFQQ